jgi:O-acetyl-ADP-ribose deacetylase (regulator of RNase III)
MSEQQRFLGGRVTARVSDITQQHVYAIVNAANSSLLGGGGVDGAIHRAGGPEILKECRELRRHGYDDGLPTGEAVITTAGNLPARHVIHTVGPIYGQHHGREAQLLAACYTNSLLLSIRHSLSTIAFPAISTGVYGYPRDEAARVVSAAIEQFLLTEASVNEVRLVFLKPADLDLFLSHQKFSS